MRSLSTLTRQSQTYQLEVSKHVIYEYFHCYDQIFISPFTFLSTVITDAFHSHRLCVCVSWINYFVSSVGEMHQKCRGWRRMKEKKRKRKTREESCFFSICVSSWTFLKEKSCCCQCFVKHTRTQRASLDDRYPNHAGERGDFLSCEVTRETKVTAIKNSSVWHECWNDRCQLAVYVR